MFDFLVIFTFNHEIAGKRLPQTCLE